MKRLAPLAVPVRQPLSGTYDLIVPAAATSGADVLAQIDLYDADALLFSDQINLSRASARDGFARRVVERTGLDLADVSDGLLALYGGIPALYATNVGGYGAGPAPPSDPLDDPATLAAALALLDRPDVLDAAAKATADLGYVAPPGAETLPSLLYLVLTSRLLDRPINLSVTGPSGAGKTHLVASVARLFPAEALYSLNALSERALVYSTTDLEHRFLIVGEAAALHRDGIGASLLRSLAWEGKIRYETVEKTNDGLKARLIEKPGPTGFITTTTKALDDELETRVFEVTVPDTPEATRVILKALAHRANGGASKEPDLAGWHAAQHWLATRGERRVTIPFGERLAELVPADAVRMRRDFGQLLALIQTHAILHQRQRQRTPDGAIIADHRDYAAVAALVGPIFGAIAAEGVTAAIRDAVNAVASLTLKNAAPATAGMVAAHLGIDKSAASRRINRAIARGWLVNDEKRNGHPAQLRLGDPLPSDRPALPDPSTLFPSFFAATVQRSDDLPHPDCQNTVAGTVAQPLTCATVPPDDGTVDQEPLQSENDVQRSVQRCLANADARNGPTVAPLHEKSRGKAIPCPSCGGDATVDGDPSRPLVATCLSCQHSWFAPAAGDAWGEL